MGASQCFSRRRPTTRRATIGNSFVSIFYCLKFGLKLYQFISNEGALHFWKFKITENQAKYLSFQT